MRFDTREQFRAHRAIRRRGDKDRAVWGRGPAALGAAFGERLRSLCRRNNEGREFIVARHDMRAGAGEAGTLQRRGPLLGRLQGSDGVIQQARHKPVRIKPEDKIGEQRRLRLDRHQETIRRQRCAEIGKTEIRSQPIETARRDDHVVMAKLAGVVDIDQRHALSGELAAIGAFVTAPVGLEHRGGDTLAKMIGQRRRERAEADLQHTD
jgi:hypothetical protein